VACYGTIDDGYYDAAEDVRPQDGAAEANTQKEAGTQDQGEIEQDQGESHPAQPAKEAERSP